MAPKKNPKAAAAEKQAILEEERNQKIAREKEQMDAAQWSIGADSRGSAKQKELEDKTLAKAQLKAEKEALLAAEEGSVISSTKKTTKAKKAKDSSLAELDAALAAVPKTKAQKLAEAKKFKDEERKKIEAEEAKKREEKKSADEILRKQAAARGIVMDHSDDLMVENKNRQESEYEEASGLDAAIGLLTVKGDETVLHPEKKQKAAYNAYYERTLPIMKEDYPGLKLSQYKQRIFDQWQKAPENPMNARRQEDL
mmetsp:Transcript_17938/g.18007  ORF Transcript_17938/g.18007 Transcript_17938/m.18007 type:complete len:255 (-) Transcript_17938:228-992(-)|eukprot:CAMPEP_0182418002 /NCGR_PEP_ID=MMETSP1167-20130531/2459_1 /TAXON_ID=2988 /ORGANISM="Mallomonas Sp, Strain CCMP3275" /LENGTH=254 /DNA_ID=CAMNT_0024591941 /DNA_START=107 /DNA_END=871 /DNA_ORIENTATION=+